jgi:hypothetical protein
MSDYLQNIEVLVKEEIAKGELDPAINLIIKFVENIITDLRATARVFGSTALDNLCQEIGAKNLSDRHSVIQKSSKLDDELIVYIATELYITGGHTAVLEDLIKFQPDKKHSILVTDIFGTGVSEAIKNRFDVSLTNIECAPKGTYLDKLSWLQQQLILQHPHQVFLFNHHQDAVAIAAVQPALGSQLIFYHHCDHQLCLGLYLSHAKHVDPHSFGYYNCRNNLGVKSTIYIPLIADDLNTRSSDLIFLANGKLRTCSSGSGHKFELPYLHVYAEEVPKIMTTTGGSHVHIGYLSAHALDTIKRDLEEREIELDRFVYIPWVKSLWQAMHDLSIDVYINSFPLGGGRASVEVMGSGTPIIGHHNYYSRLLGGTDIIYPEAFFWHKPPELYSYLISLTQENLLEQSLYSRSHYDKHHTSKIFIKCLEGLKLGEEILSPLPLKASCQDNLQAFLDDVIPSKLELDRSQSQLQLTQAELEYSRSQLQLIQAGLEDSQSQLQLAQSQLYDLYNIAKVIENSNFWKLRQLWFQLKQLVCSIKNKHNNHS